MNSSQHAGPQRLAPQWFDDAPRLVFVYAPQDLGAAEAICTWLENRPGSARQHWVILDGPLGVDGLVSAAPQMTDGTWVIEGAQHLPAGNARVIRRWAQNGDRTVVLLADRPDPNWMSPPDVAVIRARDFLIEEPELHRCAVARGITFTDDSLHSLLDHTGGWPLLVTAALSSYRAGDEVGDPSDGLRQATLAITYADLTKASGTRRVVLDRMAVAGTLTEEEIQLLGRKATAEAAALTDLGVARRRPLNGQLVVELVGAFADRFIADLGDRGEYDALRRDLALARERLGVLDCGLALAVDLQDWLLCSRIINRWADKLRWTGWRELSEATMTAMPEHAALAFPGTASAYRFLRGSAGSSITDLPSYKPVDEMLISPSDAPAHVSAASAMIVVRRLAGRFTEARDVAVAARPLAEATRLTRFERGRDPVPFWYLQAGIAHELAGDWDQARSHYTDAWKLRDHDELRLVEHDAPAKLAVQAAFRGHDVDAREWLSLLQPGAATHGGLKGFVDRAQRLTRLVLITNRLDLDEAQDFAFHWDGEPDRDEFWTYTLWSRCHFLLTVGRPLEALVLIDETTSMTNNSPGSGGINTVLHSVIRAEVLLALGRATPAALALAALPVDHRLVASPRARLLLLTGDYEKARSSAEVARRGAAGWPRIQRELLLIEAVAAAASGEKAHAVRLVEGAVRSAVLHQDSRVFLTISRDFLDHMSDSVQDLALIIKQLKTSAVPDIYPASATIIDISERELVVLRALAAGRSLPEVADSLYVSVNTVKSQTRSLYKKFGVNQRSELIDVASRQGFLAN